MKTWNFLRFLILIGLFISCIDDSYDLNEFSSDMEIRTSLVGPLGESKISVKDLFVKMDVDSTNIKEYAADQLLYFYYDTVSRIEIKPLKIEIEGFRKEFTGDQDVDLQNLQAGRMSFLEKMSFDVNQNSELEIIDSVLVGNTLLELDFISTIPGLLDNLLEINVKVPDQIKLPDGRKMIRITTPGNNVSIPLQGAIIDFTRETEFLFEFEAAVAPGSFHLTAGSRLEIGGRISGNRLQYKKIWGVGNFEPQPKKEIVAIDLFKELAAQDINLKFTDPRLFIGGKTNIGIPTRFTIDRVFAQNINDRTSRYAVFTESGGPDYEIPFRWTEMEGGVGTSFDEFFTNRDVNLGDLVGISPDSLEIQYTVKVGGLRPPEGNYFITDDAFIDLSWGLEIPAWFNGGTHMYLKDTMKTELGRIFGTDINLENGILYFELENGLPFKVEVELQFMAEEESGNIILITNPDLKKNLTMNGATVDPVNKTVKDVVKTKEKLEFNRTMQEDLERISHLRIFYKVEIPEEVESAKITTKDFLKVKISAYIKGGVKL
jgi:hypothetical protein